MAKSQLAQWAREVARLEEEYEALEGAECKATCFVEKSRLDARGKILSDRIYARHDLILAGEAKTLDDALAQFVILGCYAAVADESCYSPELLTKINRSCHSIAAALAANGHDLEQFGVGRYIPEGLSPFNRVDAGGGL